MVSVVIPVKNRPALVREALASLQAQTFPQWEAVVVDDRSEDETQDVVRVMATGDERIRLIVRPEATTRSGAPVCRNIGWRAARGAFIIFLDSDDLLAPACLERRVAIMQDHPDADFAVFQGKFFHREPGDSEKLFNVHMGEDGLERFLRHDLPWSTIGPIYRRSAVEAVGPWDETLPCGQDIDYGVRALIQGLRYVASDEVDYYIRTDKHLQRQKTGNDPWSADRLPAHERRVDNTYDLLQARQLMTKRRKTLLAANHLLLAECWLDHGEKQEAHRIWSKAYARELIDEGTYQLVQRYLRLHPTVLAAYFAYYLYQRLPRDLFIGKGFSIGIRSGVDDEKAVPLRHTAHPFHRHRRIVEHGPLMYTLRRSLSRLGVLRD